jgi:hypothetical protein
MMASPRGCDSKGEPTPITTSCTYSVIRRKLKPSEATMKVSELFVITAMVLLGFALASRFMNPSLLGFSIRWHGTGYVLQPNSICIALATALCFVATIYSLWMLPFNRTAMLWHFWLTTIWIAVFWFSFFQVGSALPNSRTAVWAVFVSAAVVLLTQILFVWNLLQAIFKMSRLQS